MTKTIADSFAEQVELIDPTKPVMCYRNLNRRLNGEKGFFSVKQGGIVKFHTRIIYLKDVKFLVNERLRQRVILEKRKNVHAFVSGYICTPAEFYEVNFGGFGDAVAYNPYRVAHFMCNDGPCDTAKVCMLERLWNGKMMVYAKGIKFHETPIDSAAGCGMMVESVAQHML
jgi:hypothetical protein